MKRQRNSFLTPLDVRVMESGKEFRLLHQFTYMWKGVIPIRVPRGFETDFASIPRFARIIIPKLGRYNKAAVVHDFLYQTQTFTRETADRVFLDAMRDLCVVSWKQRVMYYAVRIGGWVTWGKGR